MPTLLIRKLEPVFARPDPSVPQNSPKRTLVGHSQLVWPDNGTDITD
jgi:hypothetical protein